MDFSSIILWILYSLLLAALLFRFCKGYLRRTVSKKAKVTEKYATSYERISHSQGVSFVTDYVLTFQIDNKFLKLKTTQWVYTSVQKGDVGLLKYKGTRFISFEQ